MPDDAPAGLTERLDSDLKDAMRAGEKVRLGTIRRARAALKNAEIENRGALPDDAAVHVLRGLVKQHRESIEMVRGRPAFESYGVGGSIAADPATVFDDVVVQRTPGRLTQ